MSEDLKDISFPISGNSNIGRLLVDMGKISHEDIEQILQLQKNSKLRFGEAAKRLGLVNEQDIQNVLSKQFSYSVLTTEDLGFGQDLEIAYRPFSRQSEGIRALRTQILIRWLNEGFKTFAIAAANQNEGTSFLVSNLGIAFSQLGKKTLIIDANMRNPKQHLTYNLKQGFGLSDLLAGRISGMEALDNIPAFGQLSILTAGTIPPNPQELLGQSSFPQLIKYMSDKFDVVIVDTPPFRGCLDGQIIASVVGGAVIASRLNHTGIADLNNVKSQLAAASSIPIGAVINDF